MNRTTPKEEGLAVIRPHSGAAIAVMFLVSASAAVAASPPATTAAAPSAATKYTDQCKALEDQWTSVLGAHETDKYFARASRESEKGDRDCRSQKLAALKRGIGHFKSALKIIGVVPQI